jgi:putative ABC transport system permease protein
MLRATFKSLLARKLRLILSGLAVVLGVMFVAGSFVLTDTLGHSFDTLFADAYSHTSVQVSGLTSPAGDTGSGPTTENIPASVLDQVKAVPEVASATGFIQADGAHLVGSNGKALHTAGAPQFGINWTGTSSLVSIKDGRAPQKDDEIVINEGAAEQGHFVVGQQITVSVYGSTGPKDDPNTFTLVGTFVYSGDRDTLGGEQTVAFTTPTAQRLMLHAAGVFTAVDVKPRPGVTDTQLRDAVAKALGHDYVVQTGKQIAAKQTRSLSSALSFVNDIFLGFAGVALFVGIFLILNTFSIIVAQRTKELALLRALGGSRRQMIGSVMTEALVIGVIASTIGLGAGIGVGALLAYVFSHVGGGALRITGLGIPATAIIASYAVGVTITLIAALLPALRASRIAPIAAMRDAATPDRPLTRMTIVGSVIVAAGGALLGTGLAGAGGSTLTLIIVGLLGCFIGIAVLTPAVSRPIVGALGSLFSWSIPGMLGKRNSARNPRRTAITAAALMIGISLVVGITIVLDSAKTSLTGIAKTTIQADLVISGSDDGKTGFDSSVLTQTAAIPGVHEVAGVFVAGASIDGSTTQVVALSDPRTMTDVFSLTAASGSIATLGADQAVIDAPTATKDGVRVGDRITARFAQGGPQTFTVSGIYAKSPLFSGWAFNTAVVADFASTQPTIAYVSLNPGTAVAPVQAKVDALLADSPEASVDDLSAYIAQQVNSIDTVITIIQTLLALAIVIAILGVINTLALSVLERTREIGLLRAIGLSRAKTMYMVTVESVVISVFGAVLGIAVGIGLGTSVVQALKDKGITDLTLPYSQMVVFLVLAAITGVVAAVLPAIRAARTNVLAAISYE